jgi:hypothetical protein
MSRRLPFLGWILTLAAVAGTTSGCVDRHFVIESDPPGAIVFENGNNRALGATPLDQQFTYYGKYRFVFVRDGYQTLTVDEQISTPWWSYFPLEFVVENLLPFTIRDVRYISKPLQPMQVIPPEEIRDRAEQLRARGKSIGVPLAPAAPPVPPETILPPPRVVPLVPAPL